MVVSIFQNFNEVVQNQKIIEVLHDIKTGKYINVITYLRKSLAENKMEAYVRAKKSLPAFTPSATFKGGRKPDYLTAYNPLLVLDIDKLSKEQLTNAKALAKENPYTFSCFTSPSGNGLKILVKVNSSQENHKEAFLLLQKYYEELLQLPIDKSGKDVTRLCFVSYDTDLYLNEDAEVYLVIKQKPIQTAFTNEPFKTEPINNDYLAVYEHCIRFTEKKESYINGNRNNFVHLLANNLNRKGVPLAVATGYILSDYGYDASEVMATVKSAYSNTNEHSKNSNPTIPKSENDKAKNEDIEEEEEKPSYIDRLETFLDYRYNFRYNIVTGKLEYKTIKANLWKPITDFVENSILREILKAKVKCNINTLRNLLHSDYCQQYDPFRDYFQELETNEDEVDYITQLANTVKTTKQELWQICFKKWFVAMVACVTNEKAINQTVIVFSGKQGVGKTTWIERLIPRELKEYMFSGTINPNNKDTLIHLAECMLINLDELENLNRTEIGTLKELITKTHIRMRKAYGHNNETLPRRASFAGSVNTAQFLNDTTGSRRFLCFEVEHIEYAHNIDIDMVYAQAIELYKNGFRYWFNQEEIKEIDMNNEQYQIRSPEEELLLTWFDIADRETANNFLNTTQIAAKLADKAKLNVTDGTVMKLGKALKKYGYLRLSKKNGYVYAVKELTWEEVENKNKQKEPPPKPPEQSSISFDNP
ncbi:virulence-associated E family protein [Pseudopedobacter saltans DSM 12145]|uniref:Virulence-associated E family protein n=1 Tax=Pseudopedobacter saltans (strain ATCC 51119 / DSM 12145 / JCM 21818 / CCUG 39354 / LMG 10337 / NBRC 100064 / NCIMB 13643) TaxID=762903 RepID=F0SEB3_PSESL|nr:VapE domain-containing protein [Pseudopedobacter saltans]ADY54035.1 virulence-associated E family protein [Pseudopedobacter saltans DSM 12145]